MFLFDKDKAAAAICGGPSEEPKSEVEPDLDGALDQIGGELMNAMMTKDAASFTKSLASFIRLMNLEG